MQKTLGRTQTPSIEIGNSVEKIFLKKLVFGKIYYAKKKAAIQKRMELVVLKICLFTFGES